VTVLIDASEAEDFAEVYTKPLRSLPYDSPGQTFIAFEKPEGLSAVGKFSNVLKFIVKEVNKTCFGFFHVFYTYETIKCVYCFL
jgi:coatomer subunit gamma